MDTPPSRKASVMECLSPVLVRRSNVSHPGLAGRSFAGRYACGVCEVCVWKWSLQVRLRALREFDSCPPGHCCMKVDLTFNDQALPGALPDFGKRVYQAFCKALSARYLAHVPPGSLSWKQLACPELGSLHGRLHIHAVFFGVRAALGEAFSSLVDGRLIEDSVFRRLVVEAWPHGFVKVEQVKSRAAVAYVTKYALKNRGAVASALQEHRKAAKRARARGLAVPSFVHAWWLSFPRGRAGGLAAGFADRVAAAQPVAVVRELGDFVRPRVGGPAGREVVLSRYESRRIRRVAGLDDPASKVKRAALNPEPVEMAARELAAGSFDALRLASGHVDHEEAELAKGRVRLWKTLGR